mmetsp:Transcript_31518/g.80368  ORF Transcript_31518/g.80368 Transcript_31518/m.80368 type:complete len:460 (-) Transcript_31518:111-1490(-)
MASPSRRRTICWRQLLLALCLGILPVAHTSAVESTSCLAADDDVVGDITSVLQVTVEVGRRVSPRRTGATQGAATAAAGEVPADHSPLPPPSRTAASAQATATVDPSSAWGSLPDALSLLTGAATLEARPVGAKWSAAALLQAFSNDSARAQEELLRRSVAAARGKVGIASATGASSVFVVILILLLVGLAATVIYNNRQRSAHHMDPPETRGPSRRANDMVNAKVREAAEAARQRPASPAPSPRSIMEMPASRASITRRLMLCDQAEWSQFEGLYFSIRPEQLPADVGALGDFDVLCGGASAAPILRCSVQMGRLRQGRELVLKTTSSRSGAGVHLSSCSPAAMQEPCNEVALCDKNGARWGSLIHSREDSYMVTHQGATVLTLEGDQDDSRLVVLMGGEAVAHAAQRPDGYSLEVGVKKQVDPILMLSCILAVVIFNPRCDAMPTPVPSQRSQLPGR